MEERTVARDHLDMLHERLPHRHPREWLYDVWEELWWRYWEELWEELRGMLRDMQTDTPSKDELRFFAMAPDALGNPRLKLPTTFQLSRPEAYYRAVIEPRDERLYDRLMWGIVRKSNLKVVPAPKKGARAAGLENTECWACGQLGHRQQDCPHGPLEPPAAEEIEEKPRGGNVEPKAKGKPKGKAKAKAAPKYPAGKKLGPTRGQPPWHLGRLMA